MGTAVSGEIRFVCQDMGQGNPDRDASHRLAGYVMGIVGVKKSSP